MKNAFRALFAAAAALLAALPAQAQDSGFYVGATIGRANYVDVCAVGGPYGSCEDKATGWRLLGGYQINKNIAIEGGYHKFGTVTAVTGATQSTAEANAWEILAVGLLPIWQEVSLYGKVGAYRGEVTGNNGIGGSTGGNGTDLTWGAGVQYDFNKKFAGRLEYQMYNGVGGDRAGTTDISVFSLGVLYRF